MQSYLSILWIVLIVVFALVEVSTAQLVSIWFVGGSVAALLLSFFSSSLTLQIVAFVVVSSVLLLVTRPVLAKKVSPKRTPTNADMVIGKEATVLSAFSPTEHGRRTAEHAGSGRRTARTGSSAGSSDRSALQYCVDNDLI